MKFRFGKTVCPSFRGCPILCEAKGGVSRSSARQSLVDFSISSGAVALPRDIPSFRDKAAKGWGTLLLLLAFSAHAQQQTGAPAGIAVPPPPPSAEATAPSGIAPESRSFRIRVVDGRNGALVRGAHVQLWYDEPAGQGYVLSTNAQGLALMPAPVGQPVRVLAGINDYVDCRHPDHGAPPEGYNLDAIATHGTAAENGCGRVATHTTPGELVLFVRPAHWYEGLNRNQ